MRRAAAGAVTALLLVVAGWPGTASAADATPKEPPLVNEELVTSTLDLSGLPLQSQLVNRLVAHDIPVTTVSDPTSTIGIEYLDRPGAPPVSNGEAQLTIGGPGQTSVLTGATFGKPLPVALHAEYVRDSQVLDPAAVAGSAGEVQVRYTITNTAVATQQITYVNSAGRRYEDEEPVFAPFAGTLVATLARDVSLVSAPGALVSTTAEGSTALLWNLVLAPPLGSYQQVLTATVRGDALQVPAVAMQVMPTTTSDDPSASFASSLLDSSVTGSTDLTEGLTTLDESASTLARGAGDLEQGLIELDSAAGTLAGAASGPLLDGAEQLSSGSAELAAGNDSLAGGITTSAEGAASLDDGLSSLVAGLRRIDDGLQALAASTGLPAAQQAAATLQTSVGAIAAAVGSPGDPTPPEPPPADITLIQAVRLAESGSKAAARTSAAIVTKLDTALATLQQAGADITAAVTAATTAATGAGALYAAVCGSSPTLTPGQCAALQGVQASAASAAASAGSAGTKVGSAGRDVGEARATATGLGQGLDALTTSLGRIEAGLEQVSTGLRSGSSSSPGVYEGLGDLSRALGEAVVAVTGLATGSAEALDAAVTLDGGAGSLATGLDEAATGADTLATASDSLAAGASQQAAGTAELAGGLATLNGGTSDASAGAGDLAAGADDLQRDGTAEVLDEVVGSSVKPARAQSYLTATDARAADAMPYGPPEGAVGRVAYVATLTPPPLPGGGGAATALLGVLVLGGLALLGAARVRRVRAARG